MQLLSKEDVNKNKSIDTQPDMVIKPWQEYYIDHIAEQVRSEQSAAEARDGDTPRHLKPRKPSDHITLDPKFKIMHLLAQLASEELITGIFDMNPTFHGRLDLETLEYVLKDSQRSLKFKARFLF